MKCFQLSLYFWEGVSLVKKIDFHIHTVSNPNKDRPFDFNPDWLIEYVKTAHLDAIAITNHNLFDIDNFNRIKEIFKNINSDIAIFPGVELDISGGHSLLIYDDNEHTVNELINANIRLKDLNLGTQGALSISDVKSIFPSWETALFVYEYGKAKSITSFWEELKEATHAAGVNRAPMAIRRELNKSEDASLLFSDAHATYQGNERNDIEKLQFKNTYMDTDTVDFTTLKKVIRDKQTSLSEQMTHGKFTQSVNGNFVELSDGLNLLIGDRGTGKSYLLEDLNRQMSGDVTYLKQFQTAVNADSELALITKEHAVSARSKWVEERSKYFDNVKTFVTSEIPNKNVDEYLERLKSYSQSYATASAARNIQLLKETKKYTVSLDWLKSALMNLKKFVLKEQRIWSVPSLKTYENSVTQFYFEMRAHYRNLIYVKKRDEFLNGILDDVQRVIERTTGAQTVPNFDIISPFLYEKKREQINAQTSDLIKDTIELESLNISNYKLVTKLKPIENADEFLTYHETKEAVHRKLIIPYKKGEFDKFFENLVTMDFVKPTQSLGEYLVIINAELQTHNGAKASGGQAAGFVLMNNLDNAKDNEVILLDEPEISLDSKFITHQLVPKLQELASNHIVVVATHNSNVGSLLRPNQIILTEYSNSLNKYIVSSGDYSSGIVKTTNSQKPFFNDFVNAMESGLVNYESKGKEYASINRE